MLAYYFPPLGGAGVQRTLKFAKYLPRLRLRTCGHHGPGGQGPRLGTCRRPSHVSPCPSKFSIETREPAQSGGWRARSERILRLPSPFAKWLENGLIRTADKVALAPDVIYASMSPWEAGAAAARLAASLNVPWVADLRDPWALDEWTIYPSRLHRRLEFTRMYRTLRSAAAIVMNTPGAAAALRRLMPELESTIVAVIPNGFDATDFADRTPSRTPDKFRVVFCGYAHADLGRRYARTRILRRLLGGAADGLDPLARSHIFLLQALERLRSRQPELSDVVELHLAGVGTSPPVDSGLPRVVAHGYVPHPQAVSLMRSADLLFLPMHDLAPGVAGRTVPGKAYEYLASGRPILAAVPEGDTRDLLAQAEGVLLCQPRDVHAIVGALEHSVRSWQSQRTLAIDRTQLLAAYQRRALTRDLARLMDRAIESHRTKICHR